MTKSKPATPTAGLQTQFQDAAANVGVIVQETIVSSGAMETLQRVCLYHHVYLDVCVVM